ncbi:hypothetical protein GOC38_12185 [Sinorhizobium meliloti]|nr:hypothetical protein [Sinorhizobium meliloti]MDX0325143.1 hypothetical protein [Sinorhizobium meliloti]
MTFEIKPDAASVLFPNDVPADSRQALQMAMSQRDPANTGAASQKLDDAAARLFPNEGKTADPVESPAGGANPENVLFKADAIQFDAKPVETFISGFANSALADGDVDRALELNAAGESLVANFQEAGTGSGDVAEALAIVRERQGDTVAGPLSEERLAEEYDRGMNALLESYPDSATLNDDISKAQAFIRDLEKIAPGTIASLEATGAGSDPRLIRAAIKEAKRRGY